MLEERSSGVVDRLSTLNEPMTSADENFIFLHWVLNAGQRVGGVEWWEGLMHLGKNVS